MAKLKAFADQGTPLFADLNRAAPGLSKATVNLPKFARWAIPALQTLGNAGADRRARSSPPPTACSPTWPPPPTRAVPVGNNFSALLDTFEKTQGFQNLMNFIYNTVGSINGFDAFGHFQRSNLQLTHLRRDRRSPAQAGCEAFFGAGGGGQRTTKKKKGKKAKVRKAKIRAPLAAAAGQRPEHPGPDPAARSRPGQTHAGGLRFGSGLRAPAPARPRRRRMTEQGKQAAGDQAVSMRQASMFLQFLLGGGA